MVAITEFVVPRSMPTALAMTFPPHLVAYDRWRATTAPPGRIGHVSPSRQRGTPRSVGVHLPARPGSEPAQRQADRPGDVPLLVLPAGKHLYDLRALLAQ